MNVQRRMTLSIAFGLAILWLGSAWCSALKFRVVPYDHERDFEKINRIVFQQPEDTKFLFSGWLDDYQIHDFLLDLLKNQRQPFTHQPVSIYVYRDPEGTKGFVTCELEEGNIGHVGLLAVDHLFKRMGIGEKLLRGCIADMKSRGMAGSTIYVDKINVGAQKLYKKLGFKDDGSIDYDSYRYRLDFADVPRGNDASIVSLAQTFKCLSSLCGS